jgi:hypothetical protein
VRGFLQEVYFFSWYIFTARSNAASASAFPL